MENLSNFVIFDGYVRNVVFKDKSINFTLRVPNPNENGPKAMYFTCYVIDRFNIIYCQNYLEEGIKVKVIGTLQRVGDKAPLSIVVQSIQLKTMTQFLILAKNENEKRIKEEQEQNTEKEKVPF